MTSTFDIAEHADAIAEMQLEHLPYAEDAARELHAYRLRLAHALGLLDSAEKLRVIREEALTAAQDRLADAIGVSVEALDAVEAAGETVREACLLVARIRESRP